MTKHSCDDLSTMCKYSSNTLGRNDVCRWCMVKDEDGRILMIWDI